MQREPSPIVEVLEQYGLEDSPSRSGWSPVHCPFHSDRCKSASVNVGLGVFVCHGCDIKGDAYSIVMHQEGVRFSEAKRIIQEWTGRSGGEIPEQSDGLFTRRKLSPIQGHRSGFGRQVWAGSS